MRRLSLWIRCTLCLVTLTWRVDVAYSQDSDPTVTIQVRASADYKDTAASLRSLDMLLAAAPAREVTVSPGEDLSSVIAREFRFGRSNRFRNNALGQNYPMIQTYKRVADAVIGLNAGSFAAAVKRGKVLVPDIPEWSDSDYNPANPSNRVPKLLIYDRAQLSLNIPSSHGMTVSGDPRVIDSGREHTPLARLEYDVPASFARFLAATDPDFLAHSTAFDFPLVATLAAGALPPDAPSVAIPVTPLLKADDQQLLRGFIQSATKSAYLFVLDSGWPSKDEALIARAEIERMINAVLSANTFLPPIKIPTPAYTDPKNEHCRDIAKALAPLTSLDTHPPKIKVIYVPLTNGQGAGPLLKELVRAHYLYTTAKAAGVDGRVILSNDDLKRADETATRVSGRLPAEWPKDQPAVVTDKAIIDAILWIGNAYAGLTSINATIFTNASWTTPAERYAVNFPPRLRGALVAATGNAGDEVVGKFVDFAQRCVTQKNVVAVMNFDAQGRACSSGLVADTHLPSAFVFGFDGRIRSGACAPNESGTSFSAPRVAWILAAAEVIRERPIDVSLWGTQTLPATISMRTSQDLLGTRLDAIALLKSVRNPPAPP